MHEYAAGGTALLIIARWHVGASMRACGRPEAVDASLSVLLHCLSVFAFHMGISNGAEKDREYIFSSGHDEVDSNDACLLRGDSDSYEAGSSPRATLSQLCAKNAPDPDGPSPYWDGSDIEAVKEVVEPLAETRAGGKCGYIALWSIDPMREDA